MVALNKLRMSEQKKFSLSLTKYAINSSDRKCAGETYPRRFISCFLHYLVPLNKLRTNERKKVLSIIRRNVESSSVLEKLFEIFFGR